MSFVSRIVAVLGILALGVVVTLLLVVPQVVLDVADKLNDVDMPSRAIQIAIALLIDLVLLALILQQFRPISMRGLIVRARGARTEVSVESVQRQIAARIAQVSDVISSQTEVKTERGNAHVVLHVRARPDIVVPDKQNEINRALRQVVEKQMGLRLSGPPIIHIELATEEELEREVEVPRPEPVKIAEPPARPPVYAPPPPEPAPLVTVPAAMPVEPEPVILPPPPAVEQEEPIQPEPYLVALEDEDRDETLAEPVLDLPPSDRDPALTWLDEPEDEPPTERFNRSEPYSDDEPRP